jgi:hypothetical protein
MSKFTTRSSEKVVERRTELLKMEGMGFCQSEIVKHLSEKHQCSGRTLYRDFQTRRVWQPKISCHADRRQAYYSILNRFEQIYRKASFTFQHCRNESVKIAALKVMLDALTRIKDLANVSAAEGANPDHIELSWKNELDDRIDKIIKFSETSEEKEIE